MLFGTYCRSIIALHVTCQSAHMICYQMMTDFGCGLLPLRIRFILHANPIKHTFLCATEIRPIPLTP